MFSLATTRYCGSQVLLAVVVDWTSTSGGVDLHARLFIDHPKKVLLHFAC